MDPTEEHAKKYLEHLGFKTVKYEPDGKVPPDFLLDGRIAVEVRRLNQNEVTGSGFRGLEETAIPLQMKIRKLLASFGPPTSATSWFVSYSFGRPLPPWKSLKSALSLHLKAFMHDQWNDALRSATISHTVSVEFTPASDVHPTFFVPGGHTDQDSGGWVFTETQNNLRLCVEEKMRKIAPYRHKYPEWWLVVVDRIGYGVDDGDREFYREQLGIEHSLDKVILLNPLDYRSASEI